MENHVWLNDEEIIKRLQEQVIQLKREANAIATFLIDKNGHMIVSSGESDNFDVTSLAALVAGNVAATDGIAKLLGEKEFSVLFHEGKNEHMSITLVDGKLIMVVIFDENTPLGLVRLKIKKYGKDISETLNLVKMSALQHENLFKDITDEDIENIFKKGN